MSRMAQMATRRMATSSREPSCRSCRRRRRCRGEEHEAAQGDEEDKDIDEDEVEREEPDGLAEMVLVHVLHDRDLELARERHERKHGAGGERDPRAVAAARGP